MTSICYAALEANARAYETHEALVEGDTRWTYGQLLEQVDAAASGFHGLGIQPGERVGLMLFNQKEFLVAFYALRKLGAVVVPINLNMLPEDIGFVIMNSGIRRMVISDSLYPNLKHVPLQFIMVGDATDGHLAYDSLLTTSGTTGPVSVNDTDLAFLMYTSGTTGHPKGVMLSERNLKSNYEGFVQLAQFTHSDRMLLALPLFHAFGLIVAYAGLQRGATLILIPKFMPRSIVEALAHEKITLLPLVPTLFSVILELLQKHGNIQLPELRYCISGGASLPAKLLERIEAVLKAPVMEGYGMTETSPVIAFNDPSVGSIPSSVGKPLANIQVRIQKEDGSIGAVSETGEIQVKGDNVMLGYYNLPEETQAILTQDGWLRTGDQGYLDPQGRLFINGRIKDLIIKAGENIAPIGIEDVLYHHPAIRDAAVVGIPDPKLGEDIAACVSLKEGQSVTASELLRHCREHLPAAYVPRMVEILPELPKNPTGKIMKKRLREQLAAVPVPS